MTYTYDTGMLIAADRGHRVALAFHRRVMMSGMRPTVPAGVLAQAWRGGPQAQLSRVLKGCVVEAMGEAGARSAGALCARAGTADVTDATVVVGALRRSDVIITGDHVDIDRLVDATGEPVTVRAI